MRYTKNEMVWITIYFIACLFFGYFLACKFPIDDKTAAKNYIIDPLTLKLYIGLAIGYSLFLIGGFFKGRFL